MGLFGRLAYSKSTLSLFLRVCIQFHKESKKVFQLPSLFFANNLNHFQSGQRIIYRSLTVSFGSKPAENSAARKMPAGNKTRPLPGLSDRILMII